VRRHFTFVGSTSHIELALSHKSKACTATHVHKISLLHYPAWHDAGQERAMELVPLPEAAQRLGVSVDTVKRRLRRGELKGQRVPRPQGYSWLIELELPGSQGDSTAASTATNSNSSAGSSAELDSATVEVLNLREMLGMAQSQIAAQQEELVAKNKQIEQLHVLLQQAQAALPAPRQGRAWWRLWGKE
jgi:hypothetical protein